MSELLDRRGLALTAASAEAAKSLDRAIERFLSFHLDGPDHLKSCLVLDPECPLARILQGYLQVMARSRTKTEDLEMTLALVSRLVERACPREVIHADALARWARGDLWGALGCWQQILKDWPLDLLALRVQHFAAIYSGSARPLTEGVVAAMDRFDEQVPGYAYVLGMLAFAQQEGGDFEAGERLGREAHELDPDELWTLHAVAHALDEMGRQEEGVAWLDRGVDAWFDRDSMKAHLYWHQGLFWFDQGRFDEALAWYDRMIAPAHQEFYVDTINAAALLWRMDLAGIDVGDRWAKLATVVEPRVQDRGLVFADLHATAALAAGGRTDLALDLCRSLETYARQSRSTDAQAVTPAALPICRALIDFYEGAYDRAVDQLISSKPVWHLVGGSVVQRDVLNHFLIEATIRAGRFDQAKDLLTMQMERRPHCLPMRHRHSRWAAG
ncbi:MAG: tetratricopeptide repeat protein [Geminicoccaceae bacterium]